MEQEQQETTDTLSTNDCHYLASRLSEMDARADLSLLILEYDPWHDPGLYEQLRWLKLEVARSQLSLQNVSDRAGLGIDCRRNYCYGSRDFFETDPVGDYHDMMHRWSDADFFNAAIPRCRLSRWGSRVVRGIFCVLTWQPKWMGRLAGRPVNHPPIADLPAVSCISFRSRPSSLNTDHGGSKRVSPTLTQHLS